MKLRFAKMHGQGNDFVVFDGVRQDVSLAPADVRRIADRHFGIGCDQVLVVEKPASRENDFRYRIFNADGGEVEQCGNGARCFVKFVRAKGLTSKREIRVETRGGTIGPRLEADGEVSVDMGAPELSKPLIETLDVALRVTGRRLMLESASLGASIDEEQVRSCLQLISVERLATF